MTVKEIPKTFVYGCDNCGKENVLQNNPPFPSGWMQVKVNYDGEWHDPSYQKLFCDSCRDRMKIIIEEKQ